MCLADINQLERYVCPCRLGELKTLIAFLEQANEERNCESKQPIVSIWKIRNKFEDAVVEEKGIAAHEIERVAT